VFLRGIGDKTSDLFRVADGVAGIDLEHAAPLDRDDPDAGESKLQRHPPTLKVERSQV